ncbi:MULTISPECIES: MCE family protein [unclassified Streptomyces]|uniref:MCE family protein n=1 Tax=unclassified Streptomyces TaxID=2593676 RepID=UPI000DBA0E6A|nr:MCE family protein [Streptomyces sp. PsTaAH-137]MYT70867.1 MCE family protein [Streptomyces sp. SID8367]RAJ90573.1 phospholipid/cholesterol/gamma-HCH transport system substrate-binding protein [Streptomyces sp. PsTaAH-137]
MNRRTTARAGAGIGCGGVIIVAFLLTLGVISVPSPSFGGLEDVPLPGGADLGAHPYTITADMKDVLSLVPQSAVKVNDVAVGRVTDIELAGKNSWTARVTMRINGDVKLPADAGARIEQSSLLGEKYVQLVEPENATGALQSGARIPVSRTGRNTEVEEVFGALSLLLNGGGVNQLKTITQELNQAIGGRETQVRSTLRQVNALVTDLDDHRSDITAALDGVNRLSATLSHRKEDVDTVLTGLSPGLKTLEEQRGSLMTMLRSLDRLGDVATDTINRSKADMVADLKALAPTLKALADSGQDLPNSLQVLLTYPFTDEVMNGIKGDYLNTYLDMAAVKGTTLIPPLEENTGAGTPTATPQSERKSLKKAPGASGKSADPSSPLPLPSTTTTSSSATPSGGASR